MSKVMLRIVQILLLGSLLACAVTVQAVDERRDGKVTLLDRVIAVVNDDAITTIELEREVARSAAICSIG